MTDFDVENSILRSELHDAKGKNRAVLRSIQYELKTIQSALRTGHSDVVQERLEKILRTISGQLEK